MWAARHHACYKGFCQDLANAVLWEVNERFFQQKFDIFCSDASLKTTTGKQNLLQELVLINLVHNSHVLFQIGISLISLAAVFTLKHFLFSVRPCNVPAKTLRVKVLLAKLTLGFPCKQKPQSPRSWSLTRSFCNFGEQRESVGIFVTTRTQRASDSLSFSLRIFHHLRSISNQPTICRQSIVWRRTKACKSCQVRVLDQV